MKLWKSPVLYFGILLVIAVIGALVAPHVIAWDSYRADLEDYGRKLTGRPVSIRGPVKVTLFPWPNVILNDVRIANPEAASSPDFMKAQSVEVSMTLAGVASGQLRVETINLQKPEFWVERLATGSGTWEFHPEIDVMGADVGNRFRLDQIAIKDATIHLLESRRGGTADIQNVDATIAGAQVTGPWRVRGTGDYLGRTLDVSLNTGIWKADTPFKFGVRLAPMDGSGLAYSLDGANTGEAFEGTLRIEPTAAEGGKTDSEGALRPLVFNSKVRADFEKIALDKIEIAPRGSDGANLIGGSASITLGEDIRLKSDLSATRFDLDSIAGAQVRGLIREGNGLEALEAIVDTLPHALEAAIKVKVVSLIAGGESLENIVASFRAGDGTIRIDEISGKMPGQAEGLFSGIFAATDKGPQIAGDIAFEAFNLREFMSWLAPERKEDIAKAWTGSRGLFKFDGRLDAAGKAIRLTNARFQIDDTLGSGTAILSGGTRTSADFELKAGLIDLDAFLPQGVQIISTGNASGWSDIANLIAPIIPDSLALKLNAEKIRLNGVDATNVTLDTNSNMAGIAINSLKVSGLGDAQLDASGQINFSNEGPTGSTAATVRASDPRGLLRLLGLLPQGAEPKWSRPLGATDMKFAVEFKPQDSAPFVDVMITGNSGDLSVQGNASLSGSLDWRSGKLAGTGEVTSPSSSSIGALLGLTPVEEGEDAGRLAMTFTGSLSEQLLTDVQADFFGAQVSQEGSLRWIDQERESDGHIKIRAQHSQQMLRSLGVSVASDGVFSAEIDYALKGTSLALPAITGLWGSEGFSGKIDVTPEGVLSGELDTGSIDLPAMLGLVFLPWDGQSADAETGFSAGWPMGLSGELWVRPKSLKLFGNVEVSESQIGIVSGADGKRVEIRGFAETGDKVSVGAGIVAKGALFALDGILDMPVNLNSLAAAPDASPVASGDGRVLLKFAGEGRSPAAALSALKGSGSYRIDKLELKRINPSGFLAQIRAAKTSENVRTAIATLTSEGSIDLGNVEGVITIVDGVASLTPVKVNSAAHEVNLRPLVETATGTADISIQLSIKGDVDLPAMEIIYAGSPTKLLRTVDASALESRLGMDVLQKAMQELEAVQKEQQRILEEEARQARIDAERLADWDSHRREIQRRQREIKVFQRGREDNAKKYSAWLKELAESVKPEMTRRNKELRVYRQLRLEEAKGETRDVTGISTAPLEPPPVVPPDITTKSKPKVKPRISVDTFDPPLGPVVLVPPSSEPLVLVPPAEPKAKGLFDFLTRRRKSSSVGEQAQ